MNKLRHALAAGALMLVASTSADAQLRRSTGTSFPDAGSLPAGTCRIWIEGVPANRQPAATDCDTARRRQPSNSRIIYGTRRDANVYGNRDPRSIPGTGQYDPRYDPRSPQYDPRLDPHDNGRWDGDRNRDKSARKHEKQHDKAERKHEKEHDKEWKKSNKRGDRDHDEHDDRDHNYGDRDRDRDGRYGTRGPSRQSCVDVNRDGICDSLQSASQAIPRGIPQTVPQGTTRRVCTDANRDGKCDDGGPLVRVTP